MPDKVLSSFIFVSDTAFVDVSLEAMELSDSQKVLSRRAHDSFAPLKLAETAFQMEASQALKRFQNAADAAARRNLERPAARKESNTSEPLHHILAS
jgi:hypothetical protein